MIKIKDLKINDKVWECEAGLNIPIEIINHPKKSINEDGEFFWTVEAINFVTKQKIELMETEKYGAYGPRLYEFPQYVSHHYINYNKNIVIEDVIKSGWKI